MNIPSIKSIFENNPELLLERKRIRAIFCDVFSNNMAKVNLLLAAFDEGIVGVLRDETHLSDLQKGQFTKLIENNHSVSNNDAKWAVNTWDKAFSSIVVGRLAMELEKVAQEVQPEAKAKDTLKETQKSTMDAFDFANKEDEESYYNNPTLEEREDRIYVPCGMGKTDYGFFIYGIKRSPMCLNKNGDVFALVYNFLVKNSTITKNNMPRYLRSIKTTYEVDYKEIFRLAIVLLQMIRHNYTKDNTLEIAYYGEKDNLKYATGLITYYSDLFSSLIHIPSVELKIKLDKKGTRINFADFSGVYIKNNTEIASNAREIWYGRKINYQLTEKDRENLEKLLCEISPYDSFKEGQIEVLGQMLSRREHSVCIMPTGSGKSLIYYMASLLQPLPIFVVSPTDILIKDQIRNLRATHEIDNISHLTLTENNDFRSFELHSSINFLTPMTLQNRNLLEKFRYINNGTTRLPNYSECKIANGSLVAYIVLDEIHCISNWGHDFRPEYQMLSKYLNKFLDQINFLGFTATANYTVVEDVQRQLNIPQDNFFSPISFEKYNITYDFRCCASMEEMYEEVGKIAEQLIDRNERTIIFTKNDEISKRVSDAVGYEADIFSYDNPETYHHFVEGSSSVLIASSDLGIGVNLPNVQNTIHFGLPLSKSEYVQEIGRAGRSSEHAVSYVLYLNDDVSNVPKGLLERNTDINNIPNLISEIDNDYANVYQKLTNNCPTKDILFDKLIAIYNEFEKGQKGLYAITYPYQTIEESKQLLFMLYSIGYVHDWYYVKEATDGNGVEIIIDVCSSDTESYRKDPKKMLLRMKKHLRDYFEAMGNDRESIVKADRSSTREEVIQTYVNWYYLKYLYRHNEEFVDLYDFITKNTDKDSVSITLAIKDYFVLPFIKLKSDEARFNGMTIKEIANAVLVGIGNETLTSLERINSNRYSYKIDYTLFFGHLGMNGVFETGRLNRIVSNMPKDELKLVVEPLMNFYHSCDVVEKIKILNFIHDGKLPDCDYNSFFEKVYSSGRKDVIYYGIMAERINHYFA